MNSQKDIVVIGAGIVGVCCANYLHEMGFKVTVLEKGSIASGCSKENTGLIVTSHAIPLASPGALKYGLKRMFSPASPFYIRPRLDSGLLAWVMKFLAASKPGSMARGLRVLQVLNSESKALLEKLIISEPLSCDYHANGWLMVFTSEADFQEGRQEAELLGEEGKWL